MISTFDLDKLNELLGDFNNLTGMRITVFDETFEEIASCPEEIAPVCRFIRKNPEAEAACHACDKKACQAASSLKKTYIYHCHAGLTEAVAPVFVGGLPVAYVLFGHLFSYDDREAGKEEILRACKKYSLNEDVLTSYICGLDLTGRDKILSASHILAAVASYLCIDQMITLRRQELPVQLDAYIAEHLADDLDAQTICGHFHIGRTKLYEISRRNYGTGIAEHIRRMRVEKAKELLRESEEYSINEIADLCGFCNYNYFITVFRKETGTAPGSFRKNAQNRNRKVP